MKAPTPRITAPSLARLRRWAPLIAVGLAGAVPGAALAAPSGKVDTTRITSPTSYYDQTSGTVEFDIEGVATGTNLGWAVVDIRCFEDGYSHEIAADVPVQADGGFSAQNASLDYNRMCSVRAIPDDYSGSDLEPYAGVPVGIGHRYSETLNDHFQVSSYSDGLLAGVAVKSEQPLGYWDVEDAGGQGIDEAEAYAGETYIEEYAELWDWAATLSHREDSNFLVRVDGVTGYLTDDSLATGAVPGQTGIKADRQVDHATGDTTVTLTENVVFCERNGHVLNEYGHLSDGDCDSLVESGIRLERRYQTSEQGRTLSVGDRWISTDGADHKISLGYQYDLYESDAMVAPYPQVPVSHEGYDIFRYAGDRPVNLVIATDDDYADGSEDTNGAVVTHEQAPDYSQFDDNDTWYSWYKNRAVPAGGEIVISQRHTMMRTVAEATAVAAQRHDSVGAPAVTITSPAEGATVRREAMTLRGTAIDDDVRSLTVNGHRVVVGSDGAWEATVDLARGPNAFAVVAHDSAGNAGYAARTINRRVRNGCTVPWVQRRKLANAKRALRKAGCKVGKITRVRGGGVRKGRIVSQSRHAGTTVPADTRVRLMVSSGARKAK